MDFAILSKDCNFSIFSSIVPLFAFYWLSIDVWPLNSVFLSLLFVLAVYKLVFDFYLLVSTLVALDLLVLVTFDLDELVLL